MTRPRSSCQDHSPHSPGGAPGFSLIEFLLASLITLIVACAALELLAGTQRSALWQADMQEVLDNVRGAMDAATRHLRHAANDPRHAGFEGISILSATELRLRSDFTGSEGSSDPDKGDADGDTEDAAEDIRIRYNAVDRSLEVISEAGSPQAVAGNISEFQLRFVDANGDETSAGAAVRGVWITITGDGSVPDPFTNRPFKVQIVGYVRLLARR